MSAGEQKAIEDQAGHWFAQQRLGPSEAFDWIRFREWLEADPRHRQAYARVEQAAAAVEELKRAGALGAAPRRRFPLVWVAPTLALAAAASALFVVFGPLQAPQARYATDIAQLETHTLPDGSLVTLGPLSRMEVRFSERGRRVVLTSGQAFFDVTRDAARPFSVEAGDARVVVHGTQFDVRRGNGVVRVAVARGAVEVDASAPLGEHASARLRAGDQAEAPEHVAMLSRPHAIALSQVSPGSAGAWRQGHLSYIEAPLSELVADLNRYYAPGIRLADPSLGDFKLTASFRVDDLHTFLDTLPDAAPVTLTRAANGEIVIYRAA
jgi:transmembrane sensor